MTAIFFDVDGTLFNTQADLAATVNHTRRELGLNELSEAEVVQHVGQGARYLLTHAIPERADDFDRLWEIFKSHYAEHCVEKLTPYPGVIEILQELKAQGYKLGINTNKPNFAVKLILEKFGLTELFEGAVVAGGDGIPLKPDPESLQACAKRMRHTLSPEDWMVGDSWTDLKAAENAGIRSIFCTFGFGRLKDATYTEKIDAFSEIKKVLCSPSK